ncbi:MAG: SDR family oxidoreductase [Lachnospiraceae bacterium]|nr:SDR family oxidoreductase [Lachnospiraceae bacterium]
MPTEIISYKPKYALVTGASRGIGCAIAHSLAKEGYHLYLTCRYSKDRLSEIARRLASQYNIECTAITADMGIADDVDQVFTRIDSLDLLVNNAAISYIGLLHEMTVTDWREVMSTNLDALFYTCRNAIPLMLRDHCGKIINISSVWGSVGASMETAYSASKGGVNSFTKALAKELAPSGIQVNAIACGVINTDMNQSFSPEDMENLRSEIPADRLGQPEEVAQMVLSLLHSPDYLTGQVITMDGGWT